MMTGVCSNSCMFPINQASYHQKEMTHLTSFDTENVIATTEQIIVKLKSLRTFIHNKQLRYSIVERSNCPLWKQMLLTLLTMITEEKGLGVLFQKDLKFSSHISQKVNKLKVMLAIIKKNFWIFGSGDILEALQGPC